MYCRLCLANYTHHRTLFFKQVSLRAPLVLQVLISITCSCTATHPYHFALWLHHIFKSHDTNTPFDWSTRWFYHLISYKITSFHLNFLLHWVTVISLMSDLLLCMCVCTFHMHEEMGRFGGGTRLITGDLITMYCIINPLPDELFSVEVTFSVYRPWLSRGKDREVVSVKEVIKLIIPTVVLIQSPPWEVLLVTISPGQLTCKPLYIN